jgi:hypothetical protein
MLKYFTSFSDCSPCKRKLDDDPIVNEKISEVIRLRTEVAKLTEVPKDGNC